MTNLDSILKIRHHFAHKGPYSQSCGISSSHSWMWELDHKEDWAMKNLYFWIMVLEKTLESPLDSKKIKLVNPTGHQHWIFFGGTDTEVEAPLLWPPDMKNRKKKDTDLRVFSNESVLHIRWPKYWSFSFSISPSNEYSELISFRIDWFDLLAVQGLSRVFSNTTVQNHQFFSAQSNSHIPTWLLEKP